jgi:glyceraldehyde 3-phosphate dehydrogenase
VAVGKVVPAVQGKLTAIALRVPVVSGSLIELNVLVEKSTSIEEVNAVFKGEAEGRLKGILEYVEDPIVSSDILQNPHSSIFDSLMTDVLEGNFIKVVSWYDNEAGYSARLADLCAKV